MAGARALVRGALIVAAMAGLTACNEETASKPAEQKQAAAPAATPAAPPAAAPAPSAPAATAAAPVAPAAAAKPLSLGQSGIGGLTAKTPFTRDAIAAALPGLTVVETMLPAGEGTQAKGFQGQQGGKTVLTVLGTGSQVQRVVVSDPSIPAGSIKLGTTYSNAFGDAGPTKCVPGMEEESGKVLCPAPGMSAVTMVFAGDYNGPDGELPPGNVLMKWPVVSLVWRAN